MLLCSGRCGSRLCYLHSFLLARNVTAKFTRCFVGMSMQAGGPAGVIEALSIGLGPRDGELVVTSALNGDTRLMGPRRVNARVISKVAAEHGVAWGAITCADNTTARPTLSFRRNDEWSAATGIAIEANKSAADAVISWALGQAEVTVQLVQTPPSRGPVKCMTFKSSGTLHSSAIDRLLATVGIINVFVTSKGFEVMLAKESSTLGSLHHLSATRALRPHMHVRKAAKPARRRRRRGKRP